jgi:4-amino-4-deoxy-L-arabinose transferase-like glycosyltransferase
VVAILERVLLYIFYRPVLYHDTGGYRRLAEAILNGWKYYDGTRTPGYPFFLVIFGSDEHVYAAQLIFGFFTTLLLFYVGWRATGKGWGGALVALVHSLNLQQLFFEANLITESLTTFFIVIALAGLAWLLYSGGKHHLTHILVVALGISLATGAAALTRPLFIILPFLAGFFLLAFWRVRPVVRWSTALMAGLPALLMIAFWANFIHKNFDRWDLTTMTGYQLVQHTGVFFEYVPDEYAAIRDTFIKYRDAQTAATGSPTDAIWDAIPALQKVSGLGFYPLSDLMGKISIQLIANHPFLYLRGVIQGWFWFWKAPVYWAPQQVTNQALQLTGRVLVFIERGGLFVCNLIFIAGSIALLWKRVRQILNVDLFQYFSITTIWLTSFLQAMLDHGDNLRFLVPLQTLLVLIVLWGGIRLLTAWPKSKIILTKGAF